MDSKYVAELFLNEPKIESLMKFPTIGQPLISRTAPISDLSVSSV